MRRIARFVIDVAAMSGASITTYVLTGSVPYSGLAMLLVGLYGVWCYTDGFISGHK